MMERPIIFSGPMVKALLAGRKTQTRRIIKAPRGVDLCAPAWCSGSRWQCDADGWWCGTCGAGVSASVKNPEGVTNMRCPYGAKGDQLWVRETWRPSEALGPWDVNVRYAADGAQRLVMDGEFGERDWNWPKAAERGNVSPLHMPRWASRISLVLERVRVERLNDITEADAEAEGAQEPALVPIIGVGWSSRDLFAKLWEHIHGKGSWVANPWLWVMDFKVEVKP